MKSGRQKTSSCGQRRAITVLAALLFIVQSMLAGVGPVRGADDVALDRLFAVVCSHDGPASLAPDTPQGEPQDGHGLCCVLGCPMGGGPGLATLPDQPNLPPAFNRSASLVELRFEQSPPAHRPPHVFGARAPPDLEI